MFMTGIFLASALCTEELTSALWPYASRKINYVDKYVSKSVGIEPSAPIMVGTVLDDVCHILSTSIWRSRYLVYSPQISEPFRY